MQLDNCFQIISKNVVALKNIFISLISRSNFPLISWIDFTNYCETTKIVDKNVVLATIDRLFIATNVELQQTDETKEKALSRYQFFEILVRLANAKFKDPGIVATSAEAL